MSKFDRKELSPRVYAILKMIESYTEDRHTQGSRFINANTQQKWELLEDILTEQVQKVIYSTETCKVCHEGTAHLMHWCEDCGSERICSYSTSL
jgi:hypothetical protein